MGVLRFLVQPSHQLSPEIVERVYMSGLDQVPWRCQVRMADDGFSIQRDVSDSGNVRLPWYVAGHGQLLLSTATLMERAEPYQLEVELARGKLTQVRHHLAEWQAMGLVIPGALKDRLHVAIERFARAATQQHQPAVAARYASEALVAAVDAADQLGSCYSEQALAARHRQAPRLDTLLAVNLGDWVPDGDAARWLPAAFNAAVVPMRWTQAAAQEGRYDWSLTDRQLAWCAAHKLRVIGGPLLELDRQGLPDWLYLWEGDLKSLAAVMAQHLDAVVGRFRGKVALWQVAARANLASPLGLDEEQTVHLVVHALDAMRRLDAQAPVIVGFDQPWAEYMGRQPLELSPWHFADTLGRAGLGLSGIGLEINLGYHPLGTAPRDLLEFSRHLDFWSSLGLPILVSLTRPSAATADPLAVLPAHPLSDAVPGGWTAESQRTWVRHIVPLLVAKPAIRAIVWNQLRDDRPHDYPHGGLIDAKGGRKPALSALAAIRNAHLEPDPAD